MVGDERPWSPAQRDDWLAAIDRWLAAVLPPLGERCAALEPVKERPWGAVLRVQTPGRPLYVKAVGPHGRHELRLLADIARTSPGLAPDVLALDEVEGWVLMPDHGRAVVEIAEPAAQLDAIESLLPAYAELQRSCAPMVEGWIAASVPDRSPARLPGLLEGLLDGRGAMGPVPIGRSEVQRYQELLGKLADVCDALDRSAVPRSIDHADIHGWNVLVGDGAPRLIDWGDACVSHPFSSLLVPIEWVAAKLPEGEQRAAVERLCDAYLGPWGGAGERARLGFAVWVGYVARALSNDEQCAGGTPEVVRDGQREIVALLRAWATKAEQLDRPDELLVPVLEL